MQIAERDKKIGRNPGSSEKRDVRLVRNQKGYTLIELMIVGIVVGILAGVAIPSYLTYLKRARQVEAPGALTEIKQLQGMYIAFSGNYGTLEEIGYNSSPLLSRFDRCYCPVCFP